MKQSTTLALEQAIHVVGGATSSIFPTIEALLLGGGDHFPALTYVANHKAMERYMSVMDFLFCELHMEWKFACFAYYNEGGKQLRDLIDSEEISKCTNQMLVALERAVELYRANRRESWRSYIEEVHMSAYEKQVSLAC